MPTTKRKAPRKSAGRTKRAGAKVKFLHKPNCTTCRKARSFMERHGFQLYFRDLAKEKLSAAGTREAHRTARLHAIPEPAKRTVSPEAHEGRSAIAFRSNSVDGEGAEPDSAPCDCRGRACGGRIRREWDCQAVNATLREVRRTELRNGRHEKTGHAAAR